MMKIKKLNYEILNVNNNPIDFDIYYKDNSDEKQAVIIISHGFKGWKSWGFFPYISERLADKGFIVITLNYSMNGRPSDDGTISDIEKFASNTISQEVSDLNLIINRLTSSNFFILPYLEDIWNKEIYLLGHSLGGGVSLITGKINKNVSKISLWATIGNFDRYTKRQKKEWNEKGYMEFTNLRTGQDLKINLIYLQDIENNSEVFNLPKILSELDIPVLLLHGRQDLTIPLKEIQLLIDAGGAIFESVIIEKTGHTFGIEHPFFSTNEYFEKIIDETLEFYLR